MYRHIAIVGGGAAAVAMLSELLEHEPARPLHLDWYRGQAGSTRGVAYSTDDKQHLLNVRVASMGMFGGRSQGFFEFVQRDDPQISGNDFIPRHRYGDYLDAEVERVLALGNARGHDVHVIPFAADAVVPERQGVTVLHGEQSRRVDAAVLALGAMAPRPLPGVSTDAIDSGRYVIDPWPLLASEQTCVRPPAQVMVIGTGLTAADVILSLSRRWPQTRFTATSPHGKLPAAHARVAAMPSGDSIELIEAMQDAPDVRRWLRLLRETIAHGGEWRAIIDSLRAFTPMLWAELPLEQRARFLRHGRSAWDRARHRLPPQVAQAIATLEQQGRVERQCGRLQSVTLTSEGLEVTTSHAGHVRTQRPNLVIQASGMNTRVLDTDDRLTRQLLANAHVMPDPLGLGLHCGLHGHLQHAGGQWPHLLALGSLLQGTLWEATAIPEIRQQARTIARQLLIN